MNDMTRRAPITKAQQRQAIEAARETGLADVCSRKEEKVSQDERHILYVLSDAEISAIKVAAEREAKRQRNIAAECDLHLKMRRHVRRLNLKERIQSLQMRLLDME